MKCQKCQKENRDGSKFCRFCGSKIPSTHRKSVEQNIESTPKTAETTSIGKIGNFKETLFKSNFQALRIKLFKSNNKVIFGALLFSLLLITTVYAAPKINGYIKISKAISAAKRSELSKDYNSALASLLSVSDSWSLNSQKDEIIKLKDQLQKFIKDKEIFNSALEKEQSKDLEGARKLLLTIDTDFPEYNIVKSKLSDIQDRIEGKLKADADREAAARASAERQAQIESEAKAQAQREAQAAAEAKQRSDAAAAAAAQAARDAEYRRQLEEQKRREAQIAAFLDEMVSIYNRNNNGVSYYNNAMSYYNAGSELVALTGFGQAKAIFNSTYSDALSMQSSYINLTNEYANAVNNLVSATRNYKSATDAIINHIGSGSSGMSGANNYIDYADSFMQSVLIFLKSQGR